MKCDVLIIGAGCSGSIAALKLAKEGLKVVIIEKEDKVGKHTKTKIDITEDEGIRHIVDELHLPVMKICNRSDWFSPNQTFTLNSNVNDLYFKRGSEKGCLEVEIIKKAKKYGAQIYTSTTVKKFHYTSGIVSYIEIKGRYKGKISPNYVIIADGYAGITAEKAGFTKLKDIITLCGYGIFCENLDMPLNTTWIFFDQRYAPGGYFYLGKTKSNQGVSCIVVDESIAKKPIETSYKEISNQNERIRNVLMNVENKKIFFGRSKTLLRNKIIRENIILIGDTSGTLDPLLGYGIKNSIFGGYYASQAIIDNISKKKNIKLYEKKIKKFCNIKLRNQKRKKILNISDTSKDFFNELLSEI